VGRGGKEKGSGEVGKEMGMETGGESLLTGKSASSPAWDRIGQVIDSPLMRFCKSASAGICCQKSEAVDRYQIQTGKLRDPSRASGPKPPSYHWPIIYRLLKLFDPGF
jgi:hypothetical protein